MLPNTVHGVEIDSARKGFFVRNGYCNYFVPEYHDEQRLADGPGYAGEDYGGIAYSFARPLPLISPLQTHLGYDGRWVNVAVVEVVGQVFPTYTSLRLQPGYNCVWLQHYHPGGTERWDARIVPSSNGMCTGPAGPVINVATEQPSQNVGDYPTVTRWMEGQTKHPYLGVRCGEMWCIIGNGWAHRPPRHAGHPSAGTSSRWAVRGWHDEQTLGIAPSPGSRHGILQTGPELSLVPDDLLETRQRTDFFTPAWIPVAKVIVPDDVTLPPKYGSAGYHFTRGENTIYIRASGNTPPYNWRASIVNSQCATPGACIYTKPVHWEDHSALTWYVPGTARWRWNDADEDMWVRCGLGCCTIQPD